jgi:hypothetical protein
MTGVQVWKKMLYTVKYTRCRIDTINSSGYGHMAVRNMQRIEINIHEKELCVKLVIYKDSTEIHGQQNIKKCDKHNSHTCIGGSHTGMHNNFWHK